MSVAPPEAAAADRFDARVAGRAHPETHPSRLLAIARLWGVAPLARRTPSVLELGCGDGANLLPIAAASPDARHAGVDASAHAIAIARAAGAAAGVPGVRFVEGDARSLPADLGTFDVVVACGAYSRVPSDARDALLRAVARHLAPGGVALVGFDALPGGWLRRIGWDAMQFHARGATDPAERAARARELIALLVETWKDQPGTGAALAEIFAREGDRDDASILRDDLAAQNEPAYVSAVANHARRHGLALVGDVDPGVRALGTAGPALRARLAASPPLAAEQMLDFVHLRTARRSLLVHASERLVASPDLAGLHFSLAPERRAERGSGAARADPVGDRLLAAYPSSMPAEALIDALRALGIAEEEAVARLRAAWVQGSAVPRTEPLAIAARAPERPRASALARWEATHRTLVTNLRHESVAPADACAREVLACCDGERTVVELADAVRAAIPAAETGDPRAAVARRLEQLAADALLEA